jgi:hypothetical protein
VGEKIDGCLLYAGRASSHDMTRELKDKSTAVEDIVGKSAKGSTSSPRVSIKPSSAESSGQSNHSPGELAEHDHENIVVSSGRNAGEPKESVSWISEEDRTNSSSECDDSDEDDCDDFEVLQVWLQDISASRQTRTINQGPLRTSLVMQNTFTFNGHQQQGSGQVGKWCRPILPTGLCRGLWDMMSLITVGIDMIMIPLYFLEVPTNVATEVVSWSTRIFWTMDMPLSFCTGIMQPDGSCEMRFAKIARRYLSTWFMIDLTILASDYLDMNRQDNLGFLRLGKASRMVRVVRLVRLVRLIRVFKAVRINSERIQSEKLSIVLEILVIALAVLMASHLLGCIWYGLADGQGPEERTWLTELARERDLNYKYALALHWALSQFTGGMDEVLGHSLSERVYTIGVLTLAYIVSAVFVSGLTSSMTRLHIITSHQAKQFSQLKRYLIQNAISDSLTLRIQRNAQHSVQEGIRFTPEGQVDLLRLISEPLLIDLHFELYNPVLSFHPFFGRYSRECPQIMRRVCHSATSMAVGSTGDTIFNAGEYPSPPLMYFVCAGTLQYVALSGAMYEVRAIQWVAEAALWTLWMHMGAFTCTTECRLVKVDSESFRKIVIQFYVKGFHPADYAQNFVSKLNKHMDEITDLDLDTNALCHGSETLALSSRNASKRMSKAMISVGGKATQSARLSRVNKVGLNRADTSSFMSYTST